jgi:hypothetical protein
VRLGYQAKGSRKNGLKLRCQNVKLFLREPQVLLATLPTAIKEGDLNVKTKCVTLAVIWVIGLALTSGSMASVEWDVHNTLKLKKSPCDVAFSANGRWIFVLTDKSEILIYSADGKLKDSIAVGNHINAIKAGPKEDILFVTSRKDKTIQQIHIEFIYDIDVSDSPFKGPADGPVVITVFSDFQ